MITLIFTDMYYVILFYLAAGLRVPPAEDRNRGPRHPVGGKRTRKHRVGVKSRIKRKLREVIKKLAV